jgi:hypothetical protein
MIYDQTRAAAVRSRLIQQRHGRSGGIVPPFLTSAVDGSEWSASHLCRSIHGEEAPVPIGEEAGWA